MNKKELQEKILILEAQINDIAKEAVENGEQLKINPFIPEYLGFVETEVRDKDDLLAARIYSKDGYNISRYVDINRPRWVIMEPDGRKSELLITSMYNGIVILQACGMNVSVQDYYNQNNDANSFLDDVNNCLSGNGEFVDSEVIE